MILGLVAAYENHEMMGSIFKDVAMACSNSTDRSTGAKALANTIDPPANDFQLPPWNEVPIRVEPPKKWPVA